LYAFGCKLVFYTACTAKRQYREFETNIPRKGKEAENLAQKSNRNFWVLLKKQGGQE
jgi:hypothetical protein